MGAQLRACLSTTLDSNEDVGYVELQVLPLICCYNLSLCVASTPASKSSNRSHDPPLQAAFERAYEKMLVEPPPCVVDSGI